MMNIYEKETDDIFEALKSIESTEDLLSFVNTLEMEYPDMSFADHFKQYLDNFKGTRQTLSRLSQVDKDYIYQITSGKKKADRDKIIALCLAIGMTDQECIRCCR